MNDWFQHEPDSGSKPSDTWSGSVTKNPHGSNDDGSWKDSGALKEDDTWSGGGAASGADPAQVLIDKTLPPISSAKAADNMFRIKQSQWNMDSLQAALKEKGEGVSSPKTVVPAAGSESDAIITANDQMRLGNGSGYEAAKPEFAFQAKKYEWLDEYGDVGPEVPELERDLYDDKFLNKAGDGYSVMTGGSVEVTVESENKVNPCFEWKHAGLHPVMVSNIEKCRYRVPTAVQSYCIPSILTGHDVIAISQTGTGKTAAYLIPTISRLMGKVRKIGAGRGRNLGDFNPLRDGIRAEPLIVIVVPTRELACQVFDEARRLCYRSMLRPCAAYGGGPIRAQMDDLRMGCDLLIGTPGRMCDFLQRPDLISMNRVRYTIIDEADEMVGPDWADEIGRIITRNDGNASGDHNYMMFSATFPREARALAKRHLADDHIRIRIGRARGSPKHIAQSIIWASPELKNQACLDLLMNMPPARTLIFVNNKSTCDQLDDFIFNSGMPSTSIHSGRTQVERESALRGLRDGTAPIMIATGVSARGLDIFNVMHIINYDLPSTQHGGITEYIHRIGRTARIGNTGSATSFYNERNEDIAQDLVNLLVDCGQEIPDFLEHLKPEGGKAPDFAGDESEPDDVDNLAQGTAGGDEWGAPGAKANDNENSGW